MTNKLKTTLYIGVTTNLQKRVHQHMIHHFEDSFTDQYHLELCIYYEIFDTIAQAIAREKQIKKWRREKKEQLINSKNPYWINLWETEIKHW